MLHVTAARYVGDYRIWLQFSDGMSGEVDLATSLNGPVFEPLRDIARFREVRFDPEADTIVWPNGADLAPEYLYEQAIGTTQSAVAIAGSLTPEP
jgi:hypothetical protein